MFKNLLDNAPVAVLVSRLSDGKVFYANHKLAAMVGLPLDLLVGKKTPDFYFDPSDRERVLEALRTKDNVENFELHVKRADGTPFWVEISSEPITFEGDQAIYGCCIDITERKRAEQTLFENEQYLFGVMQNVADGIITIDERGRIDNVNSAIEGMFGYSSDELIGQNVAILMTAENHRRHDDYILNYLDTGEGKFIGVGPREVVGQRKDGSTFSVELAVGEMRFGERRVFVGSLRDATKRKEAEKSLRTSETLFRQLFTDSGVGTLIIGMDGRFQRVNAAFCDMLGYSNKELLGKLFADITHADDREIGYEVLREMAARKRHTTLIEKRYLHKNGQIVWASVSGSVIHDADGNALHSVAHIQDITERKQIEEALRDSEAKLNAFFENAPIGLATYDDQLRFTKVNEAIAKINGVPAEEHIGRTIMDVVPALTPLLKTSYREILKTGKPQLNNEFTANFPGMAGDEQHWLSSRFPIPGQDGKPVGIGAVVLNITERKKAEILLRDAVESIADGFVLFDADDRVVMWNQNFADLYPELGQMLPERPTAEEMFRERYRVGAVGDFDVPVAEYVKWRMEMRRKEGGTPAVHRHRDGRWFRTTERATTDGGVVAISTDITELKSREQELYQAQKMEAVGQLTGGVAHDFNNLLTVVLGNLELLRDETEEHEKQYRLIESAIQATERGAKLTGRLLAFSRKQTLNPKGFDLNDLVTGMLELLQRTLGETIEIKTKSTDGLWPAHADPAQVESALLNLALNARDAMPNGGQLIIETSNVRFDDEYAAAQVDIDPGEYVEVAVSDSGVGMQTEILEHAFEPFYTTKEVGEGSGLGLSMVYGFAKQSGGHVTIYSGENRGTTVTLYLPRATHESHQINVDAAQDEARAADETILVVEDDPDVRTLAVALLSDLGYEVLEAGDGASAIAAMKSRSRINLLFTDVILAGGMSGPDIAEEAKRLHPAIRILFMSGYPRDAMIRRGQLQESADMLNKPFRKADLARKIRGALCKAAPIASDLSA